MTRYRLAPSWLAGAVAAFACAGASPALAAPDANAHLTWRDAMARIAAPAHGCFKANYPDTAWTSVACIRAPLTPYVPAHGGAGNAAANTVGDGHDFAAGAATPISASIGSFPAITGLTSEKGFLNQANTYSLQLNSNFFATPVCNGATSPASCLGWEQFVYSNTGTAYMQYWLINYGATCPTGGWMSFSGDCYKNSAAVAVPRQALSQLGNLSVSGKAVGNGIDTMIVTTATTAYTTTGNDSVVQLAQGWAASEYNIVGDGDGSSAKFNAGTSITVEIALTDGTTAAPSCLSNAGTTGETNNLNLRGCKTFSGATPAIGFVESN